jgi:hypothetical protein
LRGAWRVGSTHITVKSRQIVVGISIAIDSDNEFRPDRPIIPAILDTGFNQTFAIHQYHLEESAGIPKPALAYSGATKTYLGHDYDRCFASIWLHRAPFQARQATQTSLRPVLLSRSKEIIVYKYNKMQQAKNIGENDVYPRLPLLGMEALTLNQLRLYVNGKRFSFRISRSFMSWLYADDP